jgi:hypothetical protein
LLQDENGFGVVSSESLQRCNGGALIVHGSRDDCDAARLSEPNPMIPDT